MFSEAWAAPKIAGATAIFLASSFMGAAAQVGPPSEHDDPTSGIFWMSVCSRDATEHMCTGYFRAMVDVNEMFTVLYKRPMWCADGVRRIDQLKLVVLKYMKDNPEHIHGPFAGIVVASLGRAFPCPQWKKSTPRK